MISRTLKLQTRSVLSEVNCVDHAYSQTEVSAKDNKEKSEVQEGDYSPFYEQLIKRYEMLFPEQLGQHGKGEDYFLTTCKSKKNHGKNVKTYRINTAGDLDLVDKDNAVKIPEDAIESILTSSERSSNKQAMDKGIKRIFKTTIKTKGYLVKLLSSLPLPLTFSATLLIAFLCTISVSVTGIVKYTLDNELFSKINTQMNVIKVQLESLSDLLEVSTSILDAIGYNK